MWVLASRSSISECHSGSKLLPLAIPINSHMEIKIQQGGDSETQTTDLSRLGSLSIFQKMGFSVFISPRVA
jgi:hypothetical protein